MAVEKTCGIRSRKHHIHELLLGHDPLGKVATPATEALFQQPMLLLRQVQGCLLLDPFLHYVDHDRALLVAELALPELLQLLLQVLVLNSSGAIYTRYLFE